MILAMTKINQIRVEFPEAEEDYFLVDKFSDGEVNIKVFYKYAIDKMAKREKMSADEVIMSMMRAQNDELLRRIDIFHND